MSVNCIYPGCSKPFKNETRMAIHVRLYHKSSVKEIRKKRPVMSVRIRSANYRERVMENKRKDYIKSLGYSGMCSVFI